jgi:hypothetical protein
MTQIEALIAASSPVPNINKEQRCSKSRYNQSQAIVKSISVLLPANALFRSIVMASLHTLDVKLQQAQSLLSEPIGDDMCSTSLFSPDDSIPSGTLSPLAVASEERPKNHAIQFGLDENASSKLRQKTQHRCKHCFGYGHMQITCIKTLLVDLNL